MFHKKFINKGQNTAVFSKLPDSQLQSMYIQIFFNTHNLVYCIWNK